MCGTLFIGADAESILALFVCKNVRNFYLAVSSKHWTEITSYTPAEGSGQAQSCMQVQEYVTTSSESPSSAHPSQCRMLMCKFTMSSLLGQLQPLFALWAVHMQAVVLLLWLRLSCRFALVVEKVLYQSIQPCHGRSPLFSNKFLHFYILCYPFFLLFIPRVSDPAVTPWQIHLLAAWLRWIRSSSKSWLGNSWIRTRLLVRSCSR